MPAKKQRIGLVCVECGADFSVWPCKAATAKYCGLACKNKGNSARSAAKRGDIQRGRGEGKHYLRYAGGRLHRHLAAQKIGRALLPGEVVHHINGDKRDNRLENIEVLASQAHHALVHFGKLNAEQVREIREIKGETQSHIAQSYGVCQATISFIRTGKTWRI